MHGSSENQGPLPHPEVVEVVAHAALDAVVDEATQRALAGAREAGLESTWGGDVFVCACTCVNVIEVREAGLERAWEQGVHNTSACTHIE